MMICKVNEPISTRINPHRHYRLTKRWAYLGTSSHSFHLTRGAESRGRETFARALTESINFNLTFAFCKLTPNSPIGSVPSGGCYGESIGIDLPY